jgi:hypothetical protein
MAQSIFVFDFGTNEDAAQQARHKVEGWKQGFRLGNKMLLKFDRKESSQEGDDEDETQLREAAAKKSTAKKSVEKSEKSKDAESVRLLLRLDFSEHEKLTHQRWLDRIPGEDPFKSAESELIRTGDPEFPRTSELFESLS